MSKKSIIGLVAAIVVVIAAVGAFIGYKQLTKKPAEEKKLADNSGVVEYKTGLSDLVLDESLISEIKELNEAVDKFYNDKKDTDGIITEYGLMFDMADNKLIDTVTLSNEDYFSISEKLSGNVDILYIRPGDLGGIADKAIKGSELAPMTAINTADGYYVSSKDIEAVYVDEKTYKTLLRYYSFSHGDRRNPTAGSDEYKAIMAATGFAEPYDVKHIDCDDKYAVVVVGSLTDNSDIREYVLVNDNGSWSLGIDGLEDKGNARQLVNHKYPDMELELMPKYNIGSYGKIMTNLTDYIDQLKQLKLLNDSDLTDGTYNCAAGTFVYIQANSTGKRLLGHLGSDGKLQFFEVNSLEEAVANMVELDEEPPVFIVKFN